MTLFQQGLSSRVTCTQKSYVTISVQQDSKMLTYNYYFDKVHIYLTLLYFP